MTEAEQARKARNAQLHELAQAMVHLLPGGWTWDPRMNRCSGGFRYAATILRADGLELRIQRDGVKLYVFQVDARVWRDNSGHWHSPPGERPSFTTASNRPTSIADRIEKCILGEANAMHICALAARDRANAAYAANEETAAELGLVCRDTRRYVWTRAWRDDQMPAVDARLSGPSVTLEIRKLTTEQARRIIELLGYEI